MSDSTTDFFDNIGGGAGAPTAVLKNVNDGVLGEVVEMFKRDYVPFGQDKPEINKDGSTRQQLVIVLQTTLRNWQGVSRVPKVDHTDPNSAEKPASEDDGKRAVYVPERSNIQFAIGRAVQAAGIKFEVGTTLGVKVANLKDTGKGNPLKEHEAVLRPKSVSDGFFGDSAPAAEAAPAAPAAEATPAPAAAAPAPSAPAAQDPWASSPAASASEPPF